MVTKKTNIFRMLLAIAATRAMKPMTTQESHVLPQAASSTQEQAPRTTVQDLLEPEVFRWHNFLKPEEYGDDGVFFIGSVRVSMLLASRKPTDSGKPSDLEEKCTLRLDSQNHEGPGPEYITGAITLKLSDLQWPGGSLPVELDLSFIIFRKESDHPEIKGVLRVILRGGIWEWPNEKPISDQALLEALNKMEIRLGLHFETERWIVSTETGFCLKRLVESTKKQFTWSNHHHPFPVPFKNYLIYPPRNLLIEMESIKPPKEEPLHLKKPLDLTQVHTLILDSQSEQESPGCNRGYVTATIKLRPADLRYPGGLAPNPVELDLSLNCYAPNFYTKKGMVVKNGIPCPAQPDRNQAVLRVILRGGIWEWPNEQPISDQALLEALNKISVGIAYTGWSRGPVWFADAETGFCFDRPDDDNSEGLWLYRVVSGPSMVADATTGFCFGRPDDDDSEGS